MIARNRRVAAAAVRATDANLRRRRPLQHAEVRGTAEDDAARGGRVRLGGGRIGPAVETDELRVGGAGHERRARQRGHLHGHQRLDATEQLDARADTAAVRRRARRRAQPAHVLALGPSLRELGRAGLHAAVGLHRRLPCVRPRERPALRRPIPPSRTGPRPRRLRVPQHAIRADVAPERVSRRVAVAAPRLAVAHAIDRVARHRGVPVRRPAVPRRAAGRTRRKQRKCSRAPSRARRPHCHLRCVREQRGRRVVGAATIEHRAVRRRAARAAAAQVPRTGSARRTTAGPRSGRTSPRRRRRAALTRRRTAQTASCRAAQKRPRADGGSPTHPIA